MYVDLIASISKFTSSLKLLQITTARVLWLCMCVCMCVEALLRHSAQWRSQMWERRSAWGWSLQICFFPPKSLSIEYRFEVLSLWRTSSPWRTLLTTRLLKNLMVRVLISWNAIPRCWRVPFRRFPRKFTPNTKKRLALAIAAALRLPAPGHVDII